MVRTVPLLLVDDSRDHPLSTGDCEAGGGVFVPKDALAAFLESYPNGAAAAEQMRRGAVLSDPTDPQKVYTIPSLDLMVYDAWHSSVPAFKKTFAFPPSNGSLFEEIIPVVRTVPGSHFDPFPWLNRGIGGTTRVLLQHTSALQSEFQARAGEYKSPLWPLRSTQEESVGTEMSLYPEKNSFGNVEELHAWFTSVGNEAVMELKSEGILSGLERCSNPAKGFLTKQSACAGEISCFSGATGCCKKSAQRPLVLANVQRVERPDENSGLFRVCPAGAPERSCFDVFGAEGVDYLRKNAAFRATGTGLDRVDPTGRSSRNNHAFVRLANFGNGHGPAKDGNVMIVSHGGGALGGSYLKPKVDLALTSGFETWLDSIRTVPKGVSSVRSGVRSDGKKWVLYVSTGLGEKGADFLFERMFHLFASETGTVFDDVGGGSSVLVCGGGRFFFKPVFLKTDYTCPPRRQHSSSSFATRQEH